MADHSNGGPQQKPIMTSTVGLAFGLQGNVFVIVMTSVAEETEPRVTLTKTNL